MVIRSVIGGKYRLKHKIGEGAMGVVWSAMNQQTSREVAVKLIVSEDDQLRHRLIREALACGQLSHRNIIEVLDAGATEDRDPYLIMPLLVGETLGDLLKRKRRLEPSIVVQIARDIAKALTAAHAASIVHRDLKPANIFLHREAGSEGAVVKVMDFGICKRLESKDEKLTATGKVIGSPSYMSPEQFAPEKGIDHRTDIWSLGVIMFEMLTGERPFQGDRMKVILSIIDSDIEIPRVSKLVRFVPPELVDIVTGCLARDREQRIGSAAQLVEMLQAIASPGDTVDVYGEVSRRASVTSTPESVIRGVSEPPGTEGEVAVMPIFPRSLDDSSAITLPREPGPRRVAARRRPVTAPLLVRPVEPFVEEVEEVDGPAEGSPALDLRGTLRSTSGEEEEDSAVTTPLSARHFASVLSAPVTPAPEPEVAAPFEGLAGGATPPMPRAWAKTVPLSRLLSSINAPQAGSDSPPDTVRSSVDDLNALRGNRWLPRREQFIKHQRAILLGMAVVVSLFLAFGFMASATGSPKRETARSSIPELAPGRLAILSVVLDAQPAVALASSPVSSKKTEPGSKGVVVSKPQTPPKPTQPRPAAGNPALPGSSVSSGSGGKTPSKPLAPSPSKCPKLIKKPNC